MLGAVVGDVIDSVLLTMMKMVKRFLNRFENNETFTCAFLTSCYTGMRTGEVFALTWDILIKTMEQYQSNIMFMINLKTNSKTLIN